MSLYNRVGELIFGTRLKRLSERFLADVSQLYRELDIPFEYSWFPIFWLLDETGTMSVTEIARELEITHSAVSQMVTTLDKKGHIAFEVDENDRRRRLVCLTDSGQELLLQVRPVWRGMHRAMRMLLNEGAHSADL
ncbi:MarR family transcriptional regulator, partial [bacterium]|nr:MarR family transcriptional regulator [bacterium]